MTGLAESLRTGRLAATQPAPCDHSAQELAAALAEHPVAVHLGRHRPQDRAGHG